MSTSPVAASIAMHFRFHPLLVALVACIALCTPGARAADAHALLASMADAMRNLDYQGSFTYQHAGRTDTLRVFHAGGPRERERIVSLSGPRTELIRDGFNVTCIQADGSATVYTRTSRRGLLPLIPDAGGTKLDAHYDVTLAGSDRVAGHLTDVIDVIARDQFRYGYRLWLDRTTHLLLRSVVTDTERRWLEQFMFVSVDIGQSPSESDLVPSQREILTTTSPAPATVVRSRALWKVDSPPPGFAFVSAHRPLNSTDDAEHLVYSDGLASVSIYVEPVAANGLDAEGLLSRGTMHIHSRLVDDWRITVLGDVPAETVGLFARTVTRAEPAEAVR